MNQHFLLYFCFLLLFACQSETSDTLFQKLKPSNTNIHFNNVVEDEPVFNVLKYGYFYNGGGVAAADFNNDGYTDLYFTGNVMQDQLYLNKANGSISFQNITQKAGIGTEKGWKTGVTVVDINDDGWMDIYVCRSAAQNASLRKNLLYINNKDNTFTESAATYGLDDAGYSTQAVFFDYDRDGDLDCFVLNHSVQEYAGFSKNLPAFKQTKDPRYSSRLLRNDNGKYIDATDEAGLLSNILSFGLGVQVSDYNDDGWLDIYVSNDYNEEDYLYLNDTKGGFKECIRQATAYTSLFSMGLDAADVNNDGTMDIVSLDMLPRSNYRIKMTSGDDNYLKYKSLLQNGFHKQYMRNMLQLNVGNRSDTGALAVPQFSEIGQLAGISNTDWSWSALLADFDLDGHKDVFITNGYEKDYTNMDFLAYTVDLQMKLNNLDQLGVIQKMPAIKVPNQLFKNTGNALFQDRTMAWGFDENTVSTGAIYADLDNDGDLDLVTNNINAKASIHENTQQNPSFKVSLQEKQSLVIGAKVGVFANGTQQWQEFIPSRGFQSAMQQPLVFALPEKTVDSVLVRWANGLVNVYYKPQTATVLELRMTPKTQQPLVPKEVASLQTFGMKYNALNINDFDVQPLLPFMQSDRGPTLSALGDLIIVSGNAYTPTQLYENKLGKYTLLDFPFKSNTFPTSAVKLVDWDQDGDTDVWLGLNGYQNTTRENVLYYFENQGDNTFKRENNFPNIKVYSVGALECADLNGDGFQDLIIGGGVEPKAYPSAAPSLVYLNNKGQISEKNIHTINAGLVRNIATYTHEGAEKVLFAAEWEPVQRLSLVDTVCVLDSIGPSGFWQSIAVDTFGQVPQIWVGNVGFNNQLAAVTDSSLIMQLLEVGKDFIPLLCFYQQDNAYPFAARDELLGQLPSLKKQFSSYDAYAKATLGDILKNGTIKTDIAKSKRIQTLASGIIKNEGGNWQFEPLPKHIQQLIVRAIVPTIEEIYLLGNQLDARVRIGDFDIQGGVKLHRQTKKVDFLLLKKAVSDAKWFDNQLMVVGKGRP